MTDAETNLNAITVAGGGFACVSMAGKRGEREFAAITPQLLKHPLTFVALVPKEAALFAVGAITGTAAKSVTAPLNRIKLVMQYQIEDPITLWVNKVWPYNNPQETYNYYSLPFYHPTRNPSHQWGGVGEVLGGNEIIDSQIVIKFRKTVERIVICELELDEAKGQTV